jgi:hypothetical protein
MIITSEFFSFNVWEWFLHSSVLERTESDLSKINWFRGVILLNPIVLVPWSRSHCVTLLSDLLRLSGIRSQSWLWVAWPRDHEVRIKLSRIYQQIDSVGELIVALTFAVTLFQLFGIYWQNKFIGNFVSII